MAIRKSGAKNVIYSRCGSGGYEMAQCKAEAPACYHCKGDHAAGSSLWAAREGRDAGQHPREWESLHNESATDTAEK